MNKQAPKSFSAPALARIAVFSAVIIVLLSFVRLLPTGDIFFFSGASLALAVLYIDGSPRQALYGYIVSSIIALLYPGWLFAWPYYVFFGLYPLVKFRLEAKGSCVRDVRKAVFARLGLKALYGLLAGAAGLGIIYLAFPDLLRAWCAKLPCMAAGPLTYLILLGLWLLFFFLYETALSLLLCFYLRRVPRPRR